MQPASQAQSGRQPAGRRVGRASLTKPTIAHPSKPTIAHPSPNPQSLTVGAVMVVAPCSVLAPCTERLPTAAAADTLRPPVTDTPPARLLGPVLAARAAPLTVPVAARFPVTEAPPCRADAPDTCRLPALSWPVTEAAAEQDSEPVDVEPASQAQGRCTAVRQQAWRRSMPCRMWDAPASNDPAQAANKPPPAMHL